MTYSLTILLAGGVAGSFYYPFFEPVLALGFKIVDFSLAVGFTGPFSTSTFTLASTAMRLLNYPLALW